ncbi:sacsin N-terminal ATP-binding-like domain-containing protein [Burkholderia vietnamiensis]|uniref:sacsin N-terminal ATP-binding-like domain-containing protein n=1 Tax=Burkholderia vietnamiensis TaxID=60552 RepID=UPI0039B36899
MASDVDFTSAVVAAAQDEALTPAAQIERLAEGKLQAFTGTINTTTGVYLDDVYAQNKSVAEHTAADYHGRFLIELVQNANDVHERGQHNGQIEVLLVEDEGDFGTLYVANCGKPFTHDNVVALSRIGMSTKPPGESIGNKGLGFRSVSHVCDSPEIYSQALGVSGAATFDGYCFTFAQSKDLSSRINHPTVLALAQSDLPMFFLPIALGTQPAIIADYAARGFSSVIRLPLRDSDSLQTARDEVAALDDESAPLLLFLDRLAKLDARVRNRAGETSSAFTLKRHEEPVASAPVDASIVTLSGAHWLLVRDYVPEDLMRRAVDDGVKAKQLHSSWKDWSGVGEVGLAVPLDHEISSPRLYTFLPMGEGATAPFHGHLHGSFFPSSNRKAVDAGVALNRLLLTQAVTLAAASVRWLADRDAGRSHSALTAIARAKASVDLLVWTNPSSLTAAKSPNERLDLAALSASEIARLGDQEFGSAEVIPCVVALGGLLSVGWRRPKEVRATFDASPTFDLLAIARHGATISPPIAPLLPELKVERMARLTPFLRQYAPNLFLDRLAPVECARIAAKVAGTLRAGKRPATSHWTAFYRDLPSFMKEGPEMLVGLPVILCDDGTVRAGRRDVQNGDQLPRVRRRRRKGEQIEPSLFFPPATRQSGENAEIPLEQLRVPAPLAGHFAFAASTLPWHGELRAAREFLERGQVSAYDGETVLTRISQVVNAGASVEEALAGLRWAFAIWRRAQATRSIKVDSSYHLLVPTADGMIHATEAVFSETWPEELLGRRLNALFSSAPPDIADFALYRKRLLAPTSHRAFKGQVALWAEFLRGLGVGGGLRALPLPSMPPTRSYEVTNFGFAKKLGLSDSAIADWKRDVGTFNKESLSHAYSTNYKFANALWHLPGQSDHERFSDDCREIYAGLVVEWLAGVGKELLRGDLRHEHYLNDQYPWSTPAGAFVRSSAWLPADDPSPEGPVRHFYRPSDVWVSSNERFPFYLRQVAVTIGKIIDRRQPDALKKLRIYGRLRVLNDPTTAIEQARFLASQYAAGTVRPHYEQQLANLYNATWKVIADKHAGDPQATGKAANDMPILVRRRADLAVTIPNKEAGLLYVRDSDDDLAPSLVASIDGLLLDIKGADRARVGAAAEALFGKKVSRLSTMRYDVKIDNVALDDIKTSEAALDQCPWLRVMLAVAMEGLRGTDAGQLPSDRRLVLERLGNIALVAAEDVAFEINDQRITAPGDRPAYVFRRSDRPTLVVTRIGDPLTWNGLQLCLPAICEAIDLSPVANGMRLLAHELASAGEEIDELSLDEDVISRLGRTLQLEDGSVTSIQHLIGERVDLRMPWIRAAIHYGSGSEALNDCDRLEGEHGADPARLLAELIPLITAATTDADALLDACRQAQSAAQFSELLELDFVRFNESLAATGSDPLTYPAVHASQLLNYIVEHEASILEALRNAAAPTLETFMPAPEYAQRRDGLRSMKAEPAWLTLYHFVPEAVLEEHVARWLEGAGAPAIGANPHGLPDLADVRSANLLAISRFATAATPIVRAWWKGPASSIPDYWREAKAAEQHIRAKLDTTGAVDVKPMDEGVLIVWCVKLGLWPDGMDPTLDRDALGIGADAIDAAAKEAQREAEERAAKARSVRVNDRDVDPEHADWTEISAEIAARLSKQVKSARLGTPTELALLKKRPDKPSTNRNPRDVPPGPDRTPQAKKDMIGRLGELVVYHWLKNRFPNQDIDKAWVSRFGALQKGKAWSDDVGYDFELKHDRRTWLIEVKSSQGDRCQFEMGESEVRAAREAARPRSGQRYVVIYVANPATSSATRIDILPNPMSEEADGTLRLLGEGVRFGFKPK